MLTTGLWKSSLSHISTYCNFWLQWHPMNQLREPPCSRATCGDSSVAKNDCVANPVSKDAQKLNSVQSSRCIAHCFQNVFCSPCCSRMTRFKACPSKYADLRLLKESKFPMRMRIQHVIQTDCHPVPFPPQVLWSDCHPNHPEHLSVPPKETKEGQILDGWPKEGRDRS